MLELYNKNELSPENKRIPEDIFSGDGITNTFALYNITPEILARVFINTNLQGTVTDFFTYTDNFGTSWISFYKSPPLGINNIILQSSTCLFFPGGTTLNGEINGYLGETQDYEFFINNNDSSKGYTEIDIIPIDEIETNENLLIKLAITQNDLDNAVGGAILRFNDITDSNNLHSFWVRITIPSRFMEANIPAYNKYNISLGINALEYNI